MASYLLRPPRLPLGLGLAVAASLLSSGSLPSSIDAFLPPLLLNDLDTSDCSWDLRFPRVPRVDFWLIAGVGGEGGSVDLFQNLKTLMAYSVFCLPSLSATVLCV